MWDELRDRIALVLTTRTIGVLCAVGFNEPGGAAVRYRSQGLDLECLLPYWADVTFYVEEHPQVLLVIELGEGCWLHYQGMAQPVAAPNWAGLLPEGHPGTAPDDLYIVVHILPKRIDLLDERHGWGTRETLEL